MIAMSASMTCERKSQLLFKNVAQIMKFQMRKVEIKIIIALRTRYIRMTIYVFYRHAFRIVHCLCIIK